MIIQQLINKDPISDWAYSIFTVYKSGTPEGYVDIKGASEVYVGNSSHNSFRLQLIF